MQTSGWDRLSWFPGVDKSTAAHLAIPTAGQHACKLHAVLFDEDDEKLRFFRYDGSWTSLASVGGKPAQEPNDFGFNGDGVPGILWVNPDDDNEAFLQVATGYPGGNANFSPAGGGRIPPGSVDSNGDYLVKYGASLTSFGSTFYTALTSEKSGTSNEDPKTFIALIDVPSGSNPNSAFWTEFETDDNRLLPSPTDHKDGRSRSDSNSQSQIVASCHGRICLAHVSQQNSSPENLAHLSCSTIKGACPVDTCEAPSASPSEAPSEAPSETPSAGPSIGITNEEFCMENAGAEPEKPALCATLEKKEITSGTFDPNCMLPDISGPPGVPDCGDRNVNSKLFTGGDSCIPIQRSKISMFAIFTVDEFETDADGKLVRDDEGDPVVDGTAEYVNEYVGDIVDYFDRRFMIVPESHIMAKHYLGDMNPTPQLNDNPQFAPDSGTNNIRCMLFVKNTGTYVFDITDGAARFFDCEWTIGPPGSGNKIGRGVMSFDTLCLSTEHGFCRSPEGTINEPKENFMQRYEQNIVGAFTYAGQTYEMKIPKAVDTANYRNGSDHKVYIQNLCVGFEEAEYTPALPADVTVNCDDLFSKRHAVNGRVEAQFELQGTCYAEAAGARIEFDGIWFRRSLPNTPFIGSSADKAYRTPDGKKCWPPPTDCSVPP